MTGVGSSTKCAEDSRKHVAHSRKKVQIPSPVTFATSDEICTCVKSGRQDLNLRPATEHGPMIWPERERKAVAG